MDKNMFTIVTPCCGKKKSVEQPLSLNVTFLDCSCGAEIVAIYDGEMPKLGKALTRVDMGNKCTAGDSEVSVKYFYLKTYYSAGSKGVICQVSRDANFGDLYIRRKLNDIKDTVSVLKKLLEALQEIDNYGDKQYWKVQQELEKVQDRK